MRKIDIFLPNRSIIRLTTVGERDSALLAQWFRRQQPISERTIRKNATIQVFALPEKEQIFVSKHFHFRTFSDFLKQQFFTTRAERAAMGNTLLRNSGFRSPRCIGVATIFRFGVLNSSQLITEQSANGTTVRELLTSTTDPKQREDVLFRLAEEIARLHRCGISHGDLQTDNVLIDQSGSFIFIDNERTKRFSRLPGIYKLRNLRQCISAASGMTELERRRFVEHYCARLPLHSRLRGFISEHVFAFRDTRRIPDRLSVRKGLWKLGEPFIAVRTKPNRFFYTECDQKFSLQD